jgi:cation:H+ antiporter
MILADISPWLLFIISAVIVVFIANKLALYGDVIAVRTNLGGLIVGTFFLAAATSLPELITSISAFRHGVPDLAVGNLFGSNMVNVLLLAIIDLVNYQVPLLRRMAVSHTLTAVLATLLMLMSVIFILADIGLTIGWVGIDSLILIGMYFGGVWLIQQENQLTKGSTKPKVLPVADNFPSLRRGIVGFLAASAVLILVVPQLVRASMEIAEITGLGSSFIGTSLLSVVTSLPELLAAVAAVRIGAFDLAVGNLFGSSVFNMLSLGVADFFYTDGRLLGSVDPIFALVALLALLLTNMALLANLARMERRFLFIELDSAAIVLVYLAGMYLLFIRGA